MTHRFRLRCLYRARDAAQRAHDAARDRGDTRAMNTTRAALREAVHACMKAEVGR